MAGNDCNAFPRVSRFTAIPVALLAVALPLGGCSFDLGSWGSDKEKPQAAEQKPTGTISGQSVSDAQSYAARGQALAKSGKTEEALAEFDRALVLDPYNVPALYGRGLIYQADKQHEQAIADFTAANGLTPQRVEPLLASATSYLAIDKTRKPLPISTRRCRPIPTVRKPGRLAASPMNVWATKPRHSPLTAARSRSAPGTKPREAASRAPAARAFSSEVRTGSRQETRQIKNPEPRSDSIGTELWSLPGF